MICVYFCWHNSSRHSDALPTVCKSRREAGQNSAAPQFDITHAKSANMSPVKHFEGVLSGLRHGYLSYLRAASVASLRSAYEPKIVEHTKSDHRNISFPPISRRITGRLVASARPQHRYRASPAYHFRFSCRRGRGVFQGRHPRLPISRARARGRWKFFGTLR